MCSASAPSHVRMGMLLFLSLLLHAFPAQADTRESRVTAFAKQAATCQSPGPATLVQLGRGLLGTPYGSVGEQGPKDEATGVVMSLAEVDCMVYLEWLLAANSLAGRPQAGRSDSLAQALLRVRFRHQRKNWAERHHFFSDWLDSGPLLRDAGSTFTGAKQRTVNLNCGDRKRWVKGLPCREQAVWWVPPAASTLDSLRDGDLIGLWAQKPGLDVTHVGLIVREKGRVMLMNASSRAMKVRLEPLDEHPAWKKGILVFRTQG